MGWNMIAPTRDALIERLRARDGLVDSYVTDPQEDDCDGLWVVQENRHMVGTRRTIILYLLTERQRRWGYQQIYEEYMTLQYYSCPLRFLDLVPAPSSKSAQAWREDVRRWHAQYRETE